MILADQFIAPVFREGAEFVVGISDPTRAVRDRHDRVFVERGLDVAQLRAGRDLVTVGDRLLALGRRAAVTAHRWYDERLGTRRAEEADRRGDHFRQARDSPAANPERDTRTRPDQRTEGLAGRGHARRIGQGQVTLVDQLLGRADGHLARGRKLVVLQRGTAELGLAFFSVGHRGFLVWTA